MHITFIEEVTQNLHISNITAVLKADVIPQILKLRHFLQRMEYK